MAMQAAGGSACTEGRRGSEAGLAVNYCVASKLTLPVI